MTHRMRNYDGSPEAVKRRPSQRRSPSGRLSLDAREAIWPHQEIQLLGPDGGPAGHRHHPVALRDRARHARRSPPPPHPARRSAPPRAGSAGSAPASDGAERRGDRTRRAAAAQLPLSAGMAAGDPSLTSIRSAVAEGTCAASVAVISVCPPSDGGSSAPVRPCSSRRHEPLATSGVELAHHVVEQQQRRRPGRPRAAPRARRRAAPAAPAAAGPASRSGAAGGPPERSSTSSRWGPQEV